MSRLTIAVRTAAVLAALAAPEIGRADVLIHAPPKRVCLGRPIEVGTWYQSYSGGPRDFSISIYAPGARRDFFIRGLATTTWRLWKFWPTSTGAYRIVYAPVTRFTKFTTRVSRC